MAAGRMLKSATGVITRERVSVIAGGAAGNHTLTGISAGDRIKSVHHLAAPSTAQAGLAAGTHTISAGEDSAGTLDIDTGLGAALTAYQLMVITAAGVHVPLADAAISEAAGVITVADGSATFAATATDVIHWIAATDAPGGAQGTSEDLTSEFASTVAADDTINNTDGTATTGGLLIVHWYDANYGIDEALGWG